MLRVGIDVGGTFTDLFAWDAEGRQVREAKVLSTPPDPSIGVMDALAAANIAAAEIDTIIHGTTIATNALIERRYPEPALITTSGFRDVIEVGRQRRQQLYNPYQVKSSPLIARERRFTISARMAADGSTVTPSTARRRSPSSARSPLVASGTSRWRSSTPTAAATMSARSPS